MSHWFEPDSALMRVLRVFADVVHLNALMVLTSLPVVTIGASLSAAYATARHELADGDGLTRCYWREFRRNLGRGSALWAVLALSGAAIAFAWAAAPALPVRMAASLAGGLWVIAFLWTWPVQARFDNTVAATLRNSLLIGLANLPRSVLLVAETAGFVVLVLMACRWLPQALFLLAVTGPGLLVFLHVGPTERAFGPLLARALAAS